MKKIILLFSIFVGLGFGLKAQTSLNLFHGDLLLPNDAEIEVFSTPDTDPVEVPLVVSNFGNGDLEVKVKRYDISLPENTQASFCWGTYCYPSQVFESPEPVIIPLGGSETSFHGDYKHNGNEGNSRVRFTFFDVNNPADSSSLIVQYRVYTINEHSFEVTLDGKTVNNNQELSFLVDPVNDPVEIIGKIKNTNNIDVSVKVKKYDLSLVENTRSNICWGVCYPWNVYDTPDAITLSPGASDDSFRCDYRHNGNHGTSSVRFTVYNTENINDTLSFIVHFQIGYLGLEDQKPVKARLSNAFPNPASTLVYFEYALPDLSQNAVVKVTNLLGTTVYSQAVEQVEGKLSIDVSNLSDGIYFYSLMLNNTPSTTRKFVVKR
ncbi:MAG: T9SS type A sorting domain-containing protein [Lentimicrobiaceae bacterium]|nr:T9SS type A sorting domain-containing protein [Lentimicrobiaceae bacterium]